MTPPRNPSPGRSEGRPTKGRRSPALAPDVSYVDYKDVALLRTFITERGKLRSRRITGLTSQQQRLVARAVKSSREMALLPYTSR